jgi:hypothetical protein
MSKATILRSPDGIVSVVVAEIGENVHAGQPILAIAATGKQWLSFNVREDMLRGLMVWTAVEVALAGAHETIPAVVMEMRPLGAQSMPVRSTRWSWLKAWAIWGYDVFIAHRRADADAHRSRPVMCLRLCCGYSTQARNGTCCRKVSELQNCASALSGLVPRRGSAPSPDGCR